ncbi:hypothetical protein U9M48_008833 [Paspalum notatum var. saurae]|uniref:Uncharacterized protein n=1 Tax=Paspalum notatum var. saurae TaxID=547442 RepID=A0AAQ3WE18_PASNO
MPHRTSALGSHPLSSLSALESHRPRRPCHLLHHRSGLRRHPRLVALSPPSSGLKNGRRIRARLQPFSALSCHCSLPLPQPCPSLVLHHRNI